MAPTNEAALSPTVESGVKRMSQTANAKDASNVERAMTEQFEKRVGLMQQMIEGEIRLRPFRALGWAVAAGLVFGLIAAR